MKITKRIYEYAESEKEITEEEVINTIVGSLTHEWVYECPAQDFSDETFTDEEIETFIEDEFIKIESEEEKKRIVKKIKEQLIVKAKELIQEEKDLELNQLKNRARILRLIDDWCWGDMDKGTVGYLLTPEEILDEIIKNGNKC